MKTQNYAICKIQQVNQMRMGFRLILFLYGATPNEKSDFMYVSIKFPPKVQYDFESSK